MSVGTAERVRSYRSPDLEIFRASLQLLELCFALQLLLPADPAMF